MYENIIASKYACGQIVKIMLSGATYVLYFGNSVVTSSNDLTPVMKRYEEYRYGRDMYDHVLDRLFMGEFILLIRRKRRWQN